MNYQPYARIGPPVQVIPPSTTSPIYIERPPSSIPLIITIVVIIIVIIVIIVVIAVLMRRRAVPIRCNTNVDCPAGQLCNNLTGNCQQCITNSNCPNNQPRCNPVTNTCQSCLSNLDCPTGSPICINGSCTGCRSNADCDANSLFPRCNLATGRCSALV